MHVTVQTKTRTLAMRYKFEWGVNRMERGARLHLVLAGLMHRGDDIPGSDV